MDVKGFQETKLTDGIYNRQSASYIFVETSAPIRHCDSIALFYQVSLNFTVKAIRQFDTNIITFQPVTGETPWYIDVCYLAPGDGATIRDVEAAISERLRGTDLIVVGDLNVDLERMGVRGQDK